MVVLAARFEKQVFMKIIMSFWSEPFLRGFCNDFIDQKTWKLSCLLSVAAISKAYGKPHLYTDDVGRKILCEELQLDFESVSTELKYLPAEYSRFYTLGRSYACAQQSEPFLHIDLDAFLYEKLPQDFSEADVIFEKLYYTDKTHFRLCRPDLFVNLQSLPDWWIEKQSNKFMYASLGVVGGKNYEYFATFYKTILEILDANKVRLDNTNMRFASEFYHEKLFLAQYTLDQYTSYQLSQQMNLNVRYVVSPNNVTNVKYAHIFTDKNMQSDLQGRIIRRIISEYPTAVSQLEKICGNKYKTPSIDVVIISHKESSIYENVIRAIVPRNIKPNNVFVSEYNLIPQDKDLLEKLYEVRLIGKSIDYITSLHFAVSRCTSDIVILLDGNVRLYKLFIEKVIAAYFADPNCVYCCAAKDARSSEKIYYGANLVDGQFVANTDAKTKILDNIIVDGLYGGMYIFPRKVLMDILKDINYIDMNSISQMAIQKEIPIKCIKNLEVLFKL